MDLKTFLIVERGRTKSPLRSAFFVGILLALALAGCRTEKLPNYPRAYREYAYVSNGKSNTVSVLDIDTYKSIKTIAVGNNPTGVAANPAGNEVYVVNAGSGTVSVIDAERNLVSGIVRVGEKPYFVAVANDGLRAYVANSASNNLSVIDLPQHKVIRNIPVGKAPGLAQVSANGKLVVTSNREDDSISIIDAQKMAVRSTIQTCRQPTELAFLPDASKVFVTCSGSGQVAVVALEKEIAPETERNSLRMSRQPAAERSGDHLLALLDVGQTPLHVAVKPDGGEAFVCNFDSNSVSEIATTTNEVGGSYLIGKNPVRGLISADNSVLYVSNFGSDSVGVYSIDDGKLIGTVNVGSHPDAMALSPNQNFLFVVDTAAGDVSVVRTAAKQGAVLLTIIPVGQQPNDIAVKAFILRKPPLE